MLHIYNNRSKSSDKNTINCKHRYCLLSIASVDAQIKVAEETLINDQSVETIGH
jgi:hypothetical protein